MPLDYYITTGICVENTETIAGLAITAWQTALPIRVYF